MTLADVITADLILAGAGPRHMAGETYKTPWGTAQALQNSISMAPTPYIDIVIGVQRIRESDFMGVVKAFLLHHADPNLPFQDIVVSPGHEAFTLKYIEFTPPGADRVMYLAHCTFWVSDRHKMAKELIDIEKCNQLLAFLQTQLSRLTEEIPCQKS
jgi:hypothetical protein